MISRTATSALAVAVGLLFATACGDDGGPESIDQVIITAADGTTSPTVRKGQTLQLQATGLRGGQVVSGVQFEWSTQTPGLVSVDNTGRVSGTEYGTARITATPVSVSGPAGTLDLPVVGAPVATLQVSPPTAFVDMNDTIQLQVVALDAENRALTGVDFTWRSSSSAATVDAQGRVVGVSPGQVQIEAVAWNDVAGSSQIRVTPVTAMAPDTGRYGGTITIQGVNLPVALLASGDAAFANGDLEVLFPGPTEGSTVPAFIRDASPTSIQVWVPVGARSGPLAIRTPTDEFVTSREFTLTAQEDIIAGALCPIPCAQIPAVVELGFGSYNPSLEARGNAFIYFYLPVTEPTPFSLIISDPGSASNSTAIEAVIIDLQTAAFPAVVYTRDLGNGAVQPGIYSRQTLPPGEYLIQLRALDLANVANVNIRRPYGIRVEAETSFQIQPDTYEPNDQPTEAPIITLPFNSGTVAFENGFALDNYTIDLAQESTITATLTAPAPFNFLYLIKGEALDVFEAFFDETLLIAESSEGEAQEQFQVTVPAGRYTLVAVENTGRAKTYSLQVTATAPAESVSPFRLEVPSIDRPVGLRTLAPSFSGNRSVRDDAEVLRLP